MQTTSLAYRQRAAGYVRPLSWGIRAAFDKVLDDSVTFFQLDVSVLDGPDILAGNDGNPLQEWDKYKYADYSDRAISLEVIREEVEPYSIAQAYADITLNNYDSYFTPNSGSPIDSYIIPKRPFRILMGFGGETVPQIVGMTDGMPTLDKSSRQVRFHILDFMSYLLDQDISETIILEDVRTHEVLDYLFQFMGLSSTQYSLDDSTNTIKFFFVEKGTKFRQVVGDLMEAEMGRLYMDEAGVIRFRNRYNNDLTPVYTFDSSNVIDYSVSDESTIINSVKIISKVREVQPLQSVWMSSIPILVRSGETIDVWAEFNDPVTSLTTPVYSDTETNQSYYTAALQETGETAYIDIDLNTLQPFSKSAKLTFENVGASDAYITHIDLYGTPAKVIDTIKVEDIDQPSIDKYGEQLYEINNEYIQDENDAESRVVILLHDFAEYGSGLEVDVKGSPALQLGDAVNVDLDGYQGIYAITKTTHIIASHQFRQRLRLREKLISDFFKLDTSILNGTDVLAP